MTTDKDQPFDASEFGVTSDSSLGLGLSLLLIGTFVSFFGRRLFPYISSTIGGLILLDGIIYGSLTFGIVRNNLMLMLALLFGLLAGILGGVLAHKFIRFGILLTSLLSSFCIAFLIYGMVIYFVPLLQNFYGILGVTSVLFII